MYNSKQIEPFLNKVHEEASKAAQEVYDKYLDEFINRVKNQMGKGHIIKHGMGVMYIEGTKNDECISLDNKFLDTLANHLYYESKVEAGFSIPEQINKK